MPADPIPADDLDDLDIRRDAALLLPALTEVVDGVPRYDGSVLIAAALLFANACDLVEADPEAALAQILDRFPDFEVDLDDDPAQGGFVFEAARA